MVTSVRCPLKESYFPGFLGLLLIWGCNRMPDPGSPVLQVSKSKVETGEPVSFEMVSMEHLDAFTLLWTVEPAGQFHLEKQTQSGKTYIFEKAGIKKVIVELLWKEKVVGQESVTVEVVEPSVTCSLDQPSVEFGPAATSDRVAVTARGRARWSVSSDSPWIKVVDSSSHVGDGVVAFDIEANSGSFRSGTLTICDQELIIDQRPVCSYTFSPSKIVATSDEKRYSLQLNTFDDCTWKAVTQTSWIVFKTDKGQGSGPISFLLKENETDRARTGTIQVKGKTLEITQETRPMRYRAHIIDSNGSAVRGEKVVFRIGAKSRETTTDENGIASIRLPHRASALCQFNGQTLHFNDEGNAYFTVPAKSFQVSFKARINERNVYEGVVTVTQQGKTVLQQLPLDRQVTLERGVYHFRYIHGVISETRTLDLDQNQVCVFDILSTRNDPYWVMYKEKSRKSLEQAVLANNKLSNWEAYFLPRYWLGRLYLDLVPQDPGFLLKARKIFKHLYSKKKSWRGKFDPDYITYYLKTLSQDPGSDFFRMTKICSQRSVEKQFESLKTEYKVWAYDFYYYKVISLYERMKSKNKKGYLKKLDKALSVLAKEIPMDLYYRYPDRVYKLEQIKKELDEIKKERDDVR